VSVYYFDAASGDWNKPAVEPMYAIRSRR